MPFARSSAFGPLVRHVQFNPYVVRRSFTPRLRHEGQFILVLLPLSAHESLFPTHVSIYPFRLEREPFGPSPVRPCPLATMPSADFWIAVRVSLDPLSPVARTRSRSPEVSTTTFSTQPPDLRRAHLIDMDFAVIGQLVRRLTPLSGSCSSARAFARRFLRTRPLDRRPCAPLPFTSIRLVEDFHLRAVVHARRTYSLSPLRGWR